MKIVSPAQGATILIGTDGNLPKLVFKTDGTGGHQWSWSIAWGAFKESGVSSTVSNFWDATAPLANKGGVLTVVANANGNSAQIKVIIIGQNPSETQVKNFINSKSQTEGFFEIIKQESGCKHFNSKGEPIKSFDNGYGICQLTNPAPTMSQVWNWQKNIDAGLKLFAEKKAAAKTHLGQSARTYTSDQLKRETISRWNGGAYHVWNLLYSRWERNPNIVCDVKTGNIGWDMTDSRNKGKTAADLRKRDSGTYSSRPQGAPWRYYGVCYVDHLLGPPPAPPAPKPAGVPFSPFGKSDTRLA